MRSSLHKSLDTGSREVRRRFCHTFRQLTTAQRWKSRALGRRQGPIVHVVWPGMPIGLMVNHFQLRGQTRHF